MTFQLPSIQSLLILSCLYLSTEIQLTAAQSSDPSSWLESYDIDAFACDLNHEPLVQSYQQGDLVRICIHSISGNSDWIVADMRYFVFVSDKVDNEKQMVDLLQGNKGKMPSIVCSEDNMCVVESILDESLFADDSTELYGYGTLIMGQRNENGDLEAGEDTPITIRLEKNASGDEVPNLAGDSTSKKTFLRGTTQGS
eukprot:scaffold26765_cov171-Cylindrotheca_fusiformis.AAC.3